MTTVPKSWVYTAAAVLALTAVGSVVLGATRGGPGRDAISDTGALTPVPDAAAAKPIADLTAEDAHFRQIAREEAQAALAKSAPPRPKPVARPADTDDGDDPSSGAFASSSDAAVTHVPAASKPAAALTPAASAGQRALIGGSSRSTPSNPYPPGSAPD